MSSRLKGQRTGAAREKGGLLKEWYGAGQMSEAGPKTKQRSKERTVGQSSRMDDDVKDEVIARDRR